MHVYVHVPFCARRCSYCDFAIAVRRVTPNDEFVRTILAEWRARAPTAGTALATIYFGGGTPSRLAADALAALIEALRAEHPLVDGAEVTLEANPDDITPDLARAWRDAGITRVSLGVQSHDPAVLEWMHRTHLAEQVPPAMDALRAAGIHDVSLDLIFGLPAARGRDWSRDLDLTLALDPTHLSLYGLTIEPHTPLARWTDRGESTPIADERYAEEYLEAHRRLVAAGFEHYEVSNAGRPGHRARHNGAYWRGVDYIGLGPSAHSLIGGRRSWNVREWADHARRIAAGEPVEAGHEQLDAGARRLEALYLGLRTIDGLEAALLPAGVADRWVAEGWAVSRAERVRLTAEGWLRLDALVGAIAHS